MQKEKEQGAIGKTSKVPAEGAVTGVTSHCRTVKEQEQRQEVRGCSAVRRTGEEESKRESKEKREIKSHSGKASSQQSKY